MLEVACFNLTSATKAISAGAQRIEFCSDRTSGGLTPTDIADVEVCSQLKGPAGEVPINVMIRSSKNEAFVASETELAQMESAILGFKPYVSGFVFGILNEDGTIDEAGCEKLVKLATPLPCTFHRAFDHANHALQEKAQIVRRCGFIRILSSGGLSDAVQGKEILRELNEVAEQLGIEVIIGGGVRSRNVAELLEATGGRVVHTAAITAAGDVVDEDEIHLILGEMARAESTRSK